MKISLRELLAICFRQHRRIFTLYIVTLLYLSYFTLLHHNQLDSQTHMGHTKGCVLSYTGHVHIHRSRHHQE